MGIVAAGGVAGVTGVVEGCVEGGVDEVLAGTNTGITPDIAGVEAGAEITSDPIGAKGLFLPSFPSGTRVILESRREPKALSLKIASSNFIFFTESSKVRKSLAIKGSELGAVVTLNEPKGEVLAGEETSATPSSSPDLKKKT